MVLKGCVTVNRKAIKLLQRIYKKTKSSRSSEDSYFLLHNNGYIHIPNTEDGEPVYTDATITESGIAYLEAHALAIRERQITRGLAIGAFIISVIALLQSLGLIGPVS